MSAAPRIALIHALNHSIMPINQAFMELWPQALRMNLLDDSLSSDLAANGQGLDDNMHHRFQTLAQYAIDQDCNALLFTCSAFGSCIESVAKLYPNIPVLKPNEAMITEAAALMPCTVGLIASFAPTLESMPNEFPNTIPLQTKLVSDALTALNQGNLTLHDQLVNQAAQQLAQQGCNVIALSQFSMARAAQLVHTTTKLPTLTTPHSAVRMLKNFFT